MKGWTDATSYSRDERGKIEPISWELEHLGMRLFVHRYHGLDGWFGSCYTMGIERYQLAAVDAIKAQREFVAYLLRRAENWASKLRKVGK